MRALAPRALTLRATTLRVAWAVAEKDLRIEVRSRAALSAVLPFAATVLLALGFALGPDRLLLQADGAGAALAGRAVRRGGAVPPVVPDRGGQRCAGGPAARAGRQGRDLPGQGGRGVPAAARAVRDHDRDRGRCCSGCRWDRRRCCSRSPRRSGTAGLGAMGGLLGLLAVQGRTRQAALPVIVLPLVTPVVIAATRATVALTQGQLPTASAAGWGCWPPSTPRSWPRATSSSDTCSKTEPRAIDIAAESGHAL